MKNRFFSLALVTAFVWGASPAAAQQAPQATRVGVDAVIEGPLQQTVPVSGRLVARQQGQVAARVAGAVETMQVHVGDVVEAGDVLATLHSGRIKATHNQDISKIREAEASLKTAKKRLSIAREELKRINALKSSAAYNRARHDDKVREVSRIEAEVAEQAAALNTAQFAATRSRLDLDDSTIRAPYPGIVSQVHSVSGAYLRVGEPVVSMVNHRDIEAEAQVPGDRIDGVKPGVAVQVELDDKTMHPGIVRAIVPTENMRTRTRTVRITTDFSGDHRPLAAEQAITVYIPAGAPRSVVSLHKDAVLHRGGKTLVVLVEDGKAAMRPVMLGAAIGTRFEILSGVKAGDQVVVRGNERLRPGQPLAPYPINAKPAKPAMPGQGAGAGAGEGAEQGVGQ